MRNEAADTGFFRPDRASLSWGRIKATGTALGFPTGPWGCMLTGAVCVETRGDKGLFTSQNLAFLSDCPPLPKHTLAASLPLQGLQIAWAGVATQSARREAMPSEAPAPSLKASVKQPPGRGCSTGPASLA